MKLFLKLSFLIKQLLIFIGVSKRTIIREKKRGMVYRVLNYDLSTRNKYSSEKAHNIYLSVQKKKQGELKIGNDTKLAKFLELNISSLCMLH